MFKRITILLLLIQIVNGSLPPSAPAFDSDSLPAPGRMVGMSGTFVPIAVDGLKLDARHPLKLDFIVSCGSAPCSRREVSKCAGRLIEYFLAGLTIPASDLWVNLSPYEKNRIMPKGVDKTLLGRDLLAEDYLLKQVAASLLYPEKPAAGEFWRKAGLQGGTAFNKVWVLPQRAEIVEHDGAVFITKATLKVMLDEDYVADQNNLRPSGRMASRWMRKLILPQITREVNQGKNFARLRQIYQALILAEWYKQAVKNPMLQHGYINRGKIIGIDTAPPGAKARIYRRYLRAYKEGVFNYIKDDGNVPRKYFSGGITRLADAHLTRGAWPLTHRPGWIVHVDLRNAAMTAEGMVNPRDRVKVLRDYLRPGITVAVYKFDPRLRRPHLVVAQAAEGRLLPVDRDRGGFLEWNDEEGRIVGKVPVRSRLPTADELKTEFLRGHPGQKIRAVSSYENLFLNEPYLVVMHTSSGYRVFHATGKMRSDIERSTYAMYVVWADNHVSIENDVRLRFIDGQYAHVLINGRKARIRWAAFLQLIEKRGRFVQPNPESFDDVRHLFRLPMISPQDDRRIPVNLMSGGIFPFARQLRARGGERIRQYFNNPRRQTFLLNTHYIDAKERLRGYIPTFNLMRRKLQEAGYTSDDYRIFVDPRDHRRKIRIRLKEGVYPFHIVGVDAKGIAYEIVVNGTSGRIGLTIREAFGLVKELGLIEAGILDHGTTIRLDVADFAYGDVRIDHDQPDGRPRATALIFYTADQAMAQARAPGGIDLRRIKISAKGNHLIGSSDAAHITGLKAEITGISFCADF